MNSHNDLYLHHFAERGYPAAELLGAGMEGAVYRLNDELVAKVWGRKEPAELTKMQAFYEQLATIGLDFETPRFLELWEVNGLHVTVEPQLSGVPLDSCYPADEPVPREVVACMLDVLDGLGSAGDLASAHSLPVLEEPQAMWGQADTWPTALQALLDRRLARFGDQLRTAVPDFDRVVEHLRGLIAELPTDRLGILHGDLIPANVLVDKALRPLAVLDFGFFTTAGDPSFDLAVTASIFDMYGPRAREMEAEIDREAGERFGLPPDRIALYRAAYAVATANVYDPEGQDGHFQWCVEAIRRSRFSASPERDPG